MNNPFIPPADPLGIPAPAELLQLLLIVTFAVHYAFLGAALGGAAFVTLGGLFGRGNSLGRSSLVARTLARPLPVVISFAISSGVAPLLFVQVLYGSFFYTSNILLGFRWLALLVLLLAGFYGSYYLASRHRSAGAAPGWRNLVAFIVTLAFAAIAITLTTNHVLSIHPELWRDVQASQTNPYALPVLWPRWIHAVLGSFVMAGLLVAHMSVRRDQTGDPRGKDLARVGLVLAGCSGIIQAAAGGHYLFALPEPFRDSLITLSDPAAFAWGVAAFCAVLGSAFAFMGGGSSNPRLMTWLSTALFSLTLLGMAWGRESLRLFHVGSQIPRGAWDYNPQLSGMILFGVVALIGVVAMVWMIRAYRRAAPASEN